MMARHALLLGVGMVLSGIVGRNLAGVDCESATIAANEKYCLTNAARGYASYPITRFGELRGCLYVDQTDPSHYRVVRVTRL